MKVSVEYSQSENRVELHKVAFDEPCVVHETVEMMSKRDNRVAQSFFHILRLTFFLGTCLSTLTSSEQKVEDPSRQSILGSPREVLHLGEFDDLIFPIPSKQFHEKYFGKQVLHLHDQVVGESGRSGNLKRASLFNVTDILAIVKKGYVKPMENMKFVHRDIEAFVKDEFDEKDPSSSVVTERTFNDHYAAGHTMLLKHAEKHSKKTHEVACVTHEGLGHLAGINIYYSPPNAAGFLLHHDGHDLLIVQTMGSKCWKVCEQPFEDQLSVDSKHYTDNPYEDPGKLKCKTYGLNTGDLLYLPRGTLHAPHTMECPGFRDIGGKESMHLSIGIDVLRSRWMNILQQTVHMYIEEGKTYTMSCAPGKVSLPTDAECDHRQLSYPPLVPFLFAKDAKNNSWSWGNILDILLVITVNSDRPVARHLREHFPSIEFGVSAATNIDVEKDSDTFKDLQFQFEILVQLLGSSCSKLLKGFIRKVLMKRNVGEREAMEREHWVRKHCRAAIKENFPANIFVPTLITFLKRMRNEFAQKCLLDPVDPAAQRGTHNPKFDGADLPSEMPSFMREQIIGEGYEQGGSEIFRETNDAEHMSEVNYNRLRELGVDEMAMDAIKDLVG